MRRSSRNDQDAWHESQTIFIQAKVQKHSGFLVINSTANLTQSTLLPHSFSPLHCSVWLTLWLSSLASTVYNTRHGKADTANACSIGFIYALPTCCQCGVVDTFLWPVFACLHAFSNEYWHSLYQSPEEALIFVTISILGDVINADRHEMKKLRMTCSLRALRQLATKRVSLHIQSH